MAGYPNKPQISYSYTGFQASLGDNSFPGTNLDNDLATLTEFASTTVDFLALLANSDGSLKFSALPQTADLAAFTQTATDAATAASASQVNAAASASAAASSASSASGSASSASGSATAAANSASSAASTLAASLLKASNLSDLADAATARTNLGLGSFATKSSIVLTDFGAGFFTADATGRGKFASGFVDQTLVDAGAVVQVGNVMAGASATGTALIPVDDTVPQSTEGDQYMSLAFTPKSATNKLRIDVVVLASSTATGDFITAALFKDSDAGALAAAFERNDTAGGKTITFTHFMTAGTTSAVTFKVRAGSNSAGTTTFNGNGGNRRFGGVAASSITVTEIKA